MEYYFTAQKLAVGYDNRPLIENIDFSLKRGEILTLIGPNGAGKSTILKSIARQLSLVSGTIYLDKSDVVTMNGNEFAKKMAVVLTDKLKTELMTCYDVVATGRYPYTGRFGVLSDEDKKAVDEAMEQPLSKPASSVAMTYAYGLSSFLQPSSFAKPIPIVSNVLSIFLLFLNSESSDIFTFENFT